MDAPPAPSLHLESRHLALELELLRQERLLVRPRGPGQVLLDRRHACLQRDAPQLPHAVRRRHPLRGPPVHRDLVEQAPVLIAERLVDGGARDGLARRRPVAGGAQDGSRPQRFQIRLLEVQEGGREVL
ncbi:MAG: hypothetical protein DMF78_07505 [Acidobacteria bacterium]|nr:MAG: hypothetical protein DMF78_07505 [Acidobacteriota bacterium]